MTKWTCVTLWGFSIDDLPIPPEVGDGAQTDEFSIRRVRPLAPPGSLVLLLGGMPTRTLWSTKNAHPTYGRRRAKVDRHCKVCFWIKLQARIPCCSYGDFGSGQVMSPAGLRARDTAGNVSGMGYRSRNPPQVHLDVTTLQGATIVTA